MGGGLDLGMLVLTAVAGFAIQMLLPPAPAGRSTLQRRLQLAIAVALLPVLLVAGLQAAGVVIWPALSAVTLGAALLGAFGGLALALLVRALRKRKSPGR